MSFSLIYLAHRLLYSIWSFVYNWYVGSLYVIGHGVSSSAAAVQRSFAVTITLKNLFQPLYQDATILGHILGFIFRFLRLIMGGLVLLAVYAFGLVVYLLWAVVPIGIIYWGFFKL